MRLFYFCLYKETRQCFDALARFCVIPSVGEAERRTDLVFAATSNHGNPTAAREVKPVVDNLLFSFVVGIASSLVAAWLYDMIRHSGKN